MEDREFLVLLENTKRAKEELKELEKREKELSNSLKQELEARGIEKKDYKEIGVKVNYRTVTKYSIDEVHLVNIITELIEQAVDEEVYSQLCDCLEEKLVVVEDKLEELIYKNIIDAEVIAPAQRSKSYKTLSVSNIKK